MDMKEKYMRKALLLAKKASGNTSPNPLVGAVIVKNDKVIAKGFHKKAGEDHAEVDALKKISSEEAKGAQMYVTLEPCSHFGRTPPCADAIIKAGIKEVYIATLDPNPLVAGTGVRKLEKAGIKVKTGVLEEEAKLLNEVFFKWILTKKPFVVSKFAMTLDGKIATITGDSKWISNEKSRMFTHELRNIYDAILVGKGTVLKDDPLLTCRKKNGKNPIRIILDSHCEIPLNKNVFTDKSTKTILVTINESDTKEAEKLGIEVIKTQSIKNRVDIEELLKILGDKNISSVLVEGGSEVHGTFFEQKLVDKVHVFIAPKIIGGCGSSPVTSMGIDKISDALFLKKLSYKNFDEDIMITGYMGD